MMLQMQVLNDFCAEKKRIIPLKNYFVNCKSTKTDMELITKRRLVEYFFKVACIICRMSLMFIFSTVLVKVGYVSFALITSFVPYNCNCHFH